MVPSLTPYDLPFSHNTIATDDGQTDEKTDRRQLDKLDRYVA